MKDVLVIQAARLGDLVQTRRLVLSLGREFRVHLAVDQNLCELAQLVYPDANIHSLKLHGAMDSDVLVANRKAFARLQAQQFECVYNCNFSGLTSAICRLFEEERITGYRPWHCSGGGESRSPWARIGFQASSMRSLSSLNLVDYWGWFCDEPMPGNEVNPVATPKGGGLGVAIAGREERRSIPLPTLAAMITVASKVLNCEQILLFGTLAEMQRARKLLKLLKQDVVARIRDLCGKTNLTQIAGEIANLDLLITPDTGLMHLAAWQGVPVLAVFLSSAWCHETGPYGSGHLVLQAARNCAPCLETSPCPHALACAEPYLRPDFSRLLALLLAGKNFEAPEGLQVWRTDFDSLGGRLKLLAGTDSQSELRSYCRQIIANWLGLGVEQADNADYRELLRKFDPDAAWMLPPWRYC